LVIDSSGGDFTSEGSFAVPFSNEFPVPFSAPLSYFLAGTAKISGHDYVSEFIIQILSGSGNSGQRTIKEFKSVKKAVHLHIDTLK
jgi:hypothetical protein